MRIFAYALLGFLLLQPLTTRPALALQVVDTVYKEVSTFSSKPISAQTIEKAFKTCSAARGWKFTKASSGKLIGQLSVRGKHYVEVDVDYSSKAYKISYRNSRNMRYDAKQNIIHKRYNSWINNLSNDVIFCLK